MINKISAELIQKSDQFTNALKERQLDLRAKRISVIQNLGATLDFFQCIDLSDNLIRKLNNLSYLPKLQTLILTNNKITNIHNIAEMVPNLQNLCLLNNKISELTQISYLSTLTKLQRLILVNNPVTHVPGYRLGTIYRISSLRILDFQKVTKQERQESKTKLSESLKEK